MTIRRLDLTPQVTLALLERLRNKPNVNLESNEPSANQIAAALVVPQIIKHNPEMSNLPSQSDVVKGFFKNWERWFEGTIDDVLNGFRKSPYESPVDLRDFNLEEANLSGANLEGADLAGTNLMNADLDLVNLKKADLTDAVLVDAHLDKTNFTGANLSNAILSASSIQDPLISELPKFQKATLLGTEIIDDLDEYGGNFLRIPSGMFEDNLIDSQTKVPTEYILPSSLSLDYETVLDLSDRNLAGINFSELVQKAGGLDETITVYGTNSNFRDCNFEGLRLAPRDFSGADLSNVNFKGVNLSGDIKLEGANLNNVKFPDSGQALLFFLPHIKDRKTRNSQLNNYTRDLFQTEEDNPSVRRNLNTYLNPSSIDNFAKALEVHKLFLKTFPDNEEANSENFEKFLTKLIKEGKTKPAELLRGLQQHGILDENLNYNNDSDYPNQIRDLIDTIIDRQVYPLLLRNSRNPRNINLDSERDDLRDQVLNKLLGEHSFLDLMSLSRRFHEVQDGQIRGETVIQRAGIKPNMDNFWSPIVEETDLADGEFNRFKILATKQDLGKESSALNHCIGESPIYQKKALDYTAFFVSMRDEEGKPVNTAEIKVSKEKPTGRSADFVEILRGKEEDNIYLTVTQHAGHSNKFPTMKEKADLKRFLEEIPYIISDEWIKAYDSAKSETNKQSKIVNTVGFDPLAEDGPQQISNAYGAFNDQELAPMRNPTSNHQKKGVTWFNPALTPEEYWKDIISSNTKSQSTQQSIGTQRPDPQDQRDNQEGDEGLPVTRRTPNPQGGGLGGEELELPVSQPNPASSQTEVSEARENIITPSPNIDEARTVDWRSLKENSSLRRISVPVGVLIEPEEEVNRIEPRVSFVGEPTVVTIPSDVEEEYRPETTAQSLIKSNEKQTVSAS